MLIINNIFFISIQKEQLLSYCFNNYKCLSPGIVVSHGQVDGKAFFSDLFLQIVQSAAADLELWFSRGEVGYLHVFPESSGSKAGAKRLGAGLLGGKAFGRHAGVFTRGDMLPALHFLLFGGRKYAAHKCGGALLDYFFNPANIAEVAAYSDNHFLILSVIGCLSYVLPENNLKSRK